MFFAIYIYVYTRHESIRAFDYSSLSFLPFLLSRFVRSSFPVSVSPLLSVSVRVIFAMRGVTGGGGGGGEFTRDGDAWGRMGWARVAEGVAQAAGNDISRPL